MTQSNFIFLLFTLLIAWSCTESTPKEEVVETVVPEYTVSLELDSTMTNLPSLQSFVHAVDATDGKWLLFAGRTNKENGDGGLHKIPKSNYMNTSFPTKSFNDQIYVYDPSDNTSKQMSVVDMISKLGLGINQDSARQLFINTNPQVTQDGDYLYVVGGYGPNEADTTLWETYSHVMRINIPNFIKLVETGTKEESTDYIAVGWNNKLMCTGGEIFQLPNGHFYLVGGQNFYGNVTTGNAKQTYLDTVYQFDIAVNGSKLEATVSDVITDGKPDSTTDFRRRDAPIVPSITPRGKAGVTIWAGVFKSGTPALPWEHPLYIQPDDASKYEVGTFDQKTHNVYACADFVAYDDTNKHLHTFLMGGIGAGPNDKNTSFTNTAVVITRDMSNADSASVSMKTVENAFGNVETLFGAESFTFITLPESAYWNGTHVIDLSKVDTPKGEKVQIGYVYGGIEAYKANPGTHGPGNSIASNKAFKMYLTQTN